MSTLYTIGYASHTFESFVKLLNQNNITYLLDVRSTPYSKYAPHFNRNTLPNILKERNIAYSFMGEYFGARLKDLTLYHSEGYLDFEKVIQSEKFNTGFNNVVLGLNNGHNVALMCAEKDPIDCHRAIMVSRPFYQKGLDVKHIHTNGDLSTQKDLENRLIERYLEDETNDVTLNKDELTSLAYRERNKAIGYRIY